MNERQRAEREQLRADQAVIREGAMVVRSAAGGNWAALAEPRIAERLASMLEAMADRLEHSPGPDRQLLVRVANEFVGRKMDRPAVRRTRRR